MKIKKDSAMTEKTFERKVFYRTFAVLAIPLVCQNVITISVNLADNIMLGAYRESALAGVAAVNQLQYLFQMLIVAFTEAMVLFLTQYWGEKRREPMAAITAHAMRAALLLSFLFFSRYRYFRRECCVFSPTTARSLGRGRRIWLLYAGPILFFR